MAEEIISYKGSDIQKRIPGLLELVMLDDVAVEMRKMNKHYAKESFMGVTVSFTLNSDNQERVRMIESGIPKLVTCSLLNSGLDRAVIRVNGKGDWLPVLPNNTINLDFKGADERIWSISYYCPVLGDTTTIIANGKY